MAFDFPNTPDGRWGLYIDALRTGNPDRQCIGVFAARSEEDDAVYLHCAMGVILTTVFGISATAMIDQSVRFVDACGQIRQDLQHFNFDANWMMARNDIDGMTFGEIADVMEQAPAYQAVLA